MKLLFCGFVDDYGGAQRMQILLANAMADRGHDVTLLTLSGSEIKYTLSENIKLHVLDNKTNNAVLNLFRRYSKIRRVIRLVKPDLIINFWLQPTYLCAFMGKKIAGKTIYAERGDPYDSEYSGIRGLLRKLSFKKIGAFAFQTEGARDFFDDAIKKRSVVIINPLWLEPKNYPRVDMPEKRIVAAGRLHHQKNHKLFIDAISELSHEFDDYIVEIYGDGELREALQAQIDRLHIENRVFLRGATTEVLNKIKDAEVFVLTSDYEGIPNALIEAMALGVPCVSTDCRPGGARTLITNEENGLIVPCGDVTAVARAIERYLNDKPFAKKCGDNARSIVYRTNPDKVFGQWEKFFESCICEVR